MNNRFLTYLLIFVFAWVVVSFFTPKQPASQAPQEQKPIMLVAKKETFNLGDPILITFKNNTPEPIVLDDHCPNPPLTVFYEEEPVTAVTAFHCPTPITIAGSGSTVIDYAPWSREIFARTGNYRVEYSATVGGEERTAATYFKLQNKGWLGATWDTVFYRPIYNTLIFLTTIVPGGNLGWAIIFLTLIFRIILLIPNQRAMESQRAMQRMQPELKAIQEKFKDDQQQLAAETMKVWKKHKVNPLGSCLPMLIQLPILIAVYYAVQNGTNLASVHLLYEPLKHVNIEAIHTLFLAMPFYTLDLALRDPFVLPVIVAGLQFVQMRLALPKADPNKLVVKKDSDKATPDMQIVNQTMTYTLPLLLGFMTATFPAGVGLYWMVNTLFGIGQQLIVNKAKK